MSVPLASAPFPSDIGLEVLLRNVLDVSLTGMQLLRPLYGPDSAAIVDFAFAYTNPAGLRISGVSEPLNDTLLGIFPHTLAAGVFTYYQRVFEANEELAYETNYQADRVDNYLKFSARRSGDYLLVSFTDTRDQPRTAVEEALRASQAAEQAARAEAEAQRQRFQEVLIQLPAYVAVYQGPDHIYQFVNPPYQSLFPHRSFLGRPFREGTPESVELGVVALFDRVYQTGEPYYYHELGGWFDFKGNGQPEQVFLNLYLHPLRDAQGRIDGVLDFSYDVTEQVRARQQVEQLNQELETRVQERTHELHEQQALLAATNQELLDSNQALQTSNQRLRRTNADLDTFVYTASHDLKSPITNLEGLLAVLRDTLPVDVQQQPLVNPLLGLLDNTVSRFRLTIEQLTELIQLQQTPAGSAQLVPLGLLVAAVQEDLAAEATAAQAQVEVAIPAGLCVSFASANLRSIVYNLLSNAFKYRDPARSAQVWVRAERQPAAVVLTVQDNGLGLSEGQQQRLFQAFQRLHTHVEGTGVGLYMIKRLIENAGATIAVASTLGVGSTFTVTFPA